MAQERWLFGCFCSIDVRCNHTDVGTENDLRFTVALVRAQQSANQALLRSGVCDGLPVLSWALLSLIVYILIFVCGMHPRTL